MGKDYFLHKSSYVDDNVIIGNKTKIWHFSHIQKGASLGKGCVVGQNVNIGNNVKIGNYVKIQNNVSVYEGVELEDYVFCGPSMVFTNINQPRSEFPQRGAEFYENTIIKKSASLGANCTIICGNKIGRYAFIGAGSVVTRDVPDFGMIIGNPGRLVGWVNKRGHRINFKDNGKSSCGKYLLKNKVVHEIII